MMSGSSQVLTDLANSLWELRSDSVSVPYHQRSYPVRIGCWDGAYPEQAEWLTDRSRHKHRAPPSRQNSCGRTGEDLRLQSGVTTLCACCSA